MKRNLSRVVAWGHELLAEGLSAGELVVDLTAGRGRDSLALWQLVGATGQLIAFDIQDLALDQTQRRLSATGACIRRHERTAAPLNRQPGIDLVPLCHSFYAQVVAAPVAAVVANLGYLPGGRQELITRPETTLAALTQAAESLRAGGRLAVVVYPGHPGGQQEADDVAAFFAGLAAEIFEVIQLRVCNRHQVPGLFVAEKRAPS